jgi:exodeoxyribonuclease VII large subunit
MKEIWNIHSTESPPTSTVLTVSALTNSIKNIIESRFGSITVQGEISNFKPNVSGHYYFDLKDASAKIGAVMFKTHAGSLSKMPKEGDQVIVKGAISVYPPHGKYQIVVHSLQFAGLGELLLKLEELKKKLLNLGWFAKERKRGLPKFPKRIGVVTSPTGSVIRDIIHVLSRRFKGFHLILNPVKVQGEGAAQEIARAIQDFNTYELADVLIVCRGGGSLEDLWAFNEEIVASAIFNSKIPVISAVGHETDFTIADFVADVRAPTPSAAAEIVISEKSAHLQFLQKMTLGLQHALSHLLKNHREKLFRFSSHPLFSIPYTLTGPHFQRLDEMRRTIDSLMKVSLSEKKLRLSSQQKELAALNPLVMMKNYREKLLRFSSHPFFSIPYALTGPHFQRLNEMRKGLDGLMKSKVHEKKLCLAGKQKELAASTPLTQLRHFKEKLKSLDKRLEIASGHQLLLRKEKLKQMVQNLISLDPKNVLKRGYSILFARNGGSVIVSALEIQPGQEITAHLSDGEVNLRAYDE